MKNSSDGVKGWNSSWDLSDKQSLNHNRSSVCICGSSSLARMCVEWFQTIVGTSQPFSDPQSWKISLATFWLPFLRLWLLGATMVWLSWDNCRGESSPNLVRHSSEPLFQLSITQLRDATHLVHKSCSCTLSCLKGNKVWLMMHCFSESCANHLEQFCLLIAYSIPFLMGFSMMHCLVI